MAHVLRRRHSVRGVRRHGRIGRGRCALRQRVAAHCGGPGAERDRALAGRAARLRRELLERRRLRDRPGILQSGAHAARGLRADVGDYGPAGRVPLHGQSHQQRRFGDRSEERRRDQAAAGGPGGELPGALARWRAHLLHAHLPELGQVPHAVAVRDHGYRHGAADGGGPLRSLQRRRHFPRGAVARRQAGRRGRSYGRRTWCRWRTWSMAG